MRALRLIFVVLLLGTSIYIGQKVFQQEKANQELTSDLIELSDVKYGLFNVDEWKTVFASVIAKKLNDFNLENTDEKEVKNQISSFLKEAIDGFEKRYNEENKSSGFAGLLKRSLSSFAGIFDQVRKDIPVFTNQIYDFLMNGGNQAMMQQYIVQELDAYTKDSVLRADYTTMNRIVKKYDADDKNDAINTITEQLKEVNSNKKTFNYSLLALFIAMILALLFFTKKSSVEFLFFIGYAFLLLGLGIMLPMISIDARIAELNFSFLGENISFTNQVLFYKSKSITQVVHLLFIQNRMDLLLVGGLILLFSIIFPVSKLLASIVYLFNNKIQNNKVVKFLVFKTGKWSMADVFVIALFMTYLGFDGIMSDQLSELNLISNRIQIISTNNSSLLFGFYAFTGFVLVGLLIATALKKTYRKN